ncbi:CoA-binding protein [Pseudodesulfovibrio sediminis]|uniref:CoA-binding protein n=1 Tax=Pseudodesulfovibrio sediminis TaxID=2810563 RepID=A0ABM7P3Q7_9BACT|nr:CoA-binding protein [Pseudodesulfovibrio sediminis]BCS87388.1 CoA-binding protein [Pseudodesulfovibrio sediminis]
MLIDMQELAPLLREVKTIAVIGAVDKPGRPVDMVGHALISMGFTVIPVHPKRRGVWGLTTYPTVNDIPIPVDMVDIFRASEFCPAHAREVLDMSPLPKIFWMQSGITSPEAQKILADSGITVVEDRCTKVEMQAMGIHR